MSELSEIREHMIRQSAAVERMAELTAAGHEERNRARAATDARLLSIEKVTTNTSLALERMRAQFDGIPEKVASHETVVALMAHRLDTKDELCRSHSRELGGVAGKVAAAGIPDRCTTHGKALTSLQRVRWKMWGAICAVGAVAGVVAPKLLEKLLK